MSKNITGWIYLNNPFTENMVCDKKCFVYIITNLLTNKKYIGKKKFTFTRKKRKKNKKHRTTTITTSDWESYFGSSKDLLLDVEKYGPQNFKREILHLCDSLGEANYLELWHQITTNALLKPEEYYNSYCGGRIHRSHVKNINQSSFPTISG